MESSETRYAKTADGVFIAYQVLGEGPVDLVWHIVWPGNIDLEWEYPRSARLMSGLASFSRLILHDHRGIGLSSRNVALPNLETRMADLHVVLDAVGADRVVLVGALADGAVNALFAATDPDRVQSIVWIEPSARSAWAADYPWGAGPEYRAGDLAALEHWGTSEYGRKFAEYQRANGNPFPEASAPIIAKQSRNACTPDVAQALSLIWYETDLRGLLPSVQTPTLLLAETDSDPSPEVAYIASLMPRAELKTVRGEPYSVEQIDGQLDEIRRFVGVDAPATGLDTILATVLFTDIVGPRNVRRRWATSHGRRSSSDITRSSVKNSRGGVGKRMTRPATASTRPSMGPLARSIPPACPGRRERIGRLLSGVWRVHPRSYIRR
jgi:pimeloyl-ACP methyl ester carboxylesterase